jgi:Iron-containing alcohol dehydrogenase
MHTNEVIIDLPRAESGGTAMNALAHCTRSLYAAERNASGDEHALEGARLIGRSFLLMLSDGHDLGARRALLEGAMRGGIALATAGIDLAHAMAQSVGGSMEFITARQTPFAWPRRFALTERWSGLRFPASVTLSARAIRPPAARSLLASPGIGGCAISASPRMGCARWRK